MNWLVAAQIPGFILLLWIFTAYMGRQFPILQNQRIVLLIAHPDDEAMFFAPALLALTRPELNNRVFILCLSSGDADGLGTVRKEELRKSALHLGLTSSEHVVVIEDDKFPDSMDVMWDAKQIAFILGRYFAPRNASQSAKEAPQASIDALITFDQGGVSGHPNHIALFHGAKQFVRNLMARHAGWDVPVKLYTLSSVNVVRKYSSVLDSMTTVLKSVVQKKEGGEAPSPLLMFSGPLGMRTAQKAMTQAHQSQMRWFRWGWIGVSRYMVVNDLKKVKVI